LGTPRPPDDHRPAALLNGLIDAYADRGIGGRSLREVAEVVGRSHPMLLHYFGSRHELLPAIARGGGGTSHGMLLHSFGSRDELLLAIVEEVERRQTAQLEDLPREPAAAIEATWADLRRPELRPFERLFFECYARAAQGEEPFARMIPAAVDGWLDSVAAQSEGRVDPALVRLSLAVTRGLLLDL